VILLTQSEPERVKEEPPPAKRRVRVAVRAYVQRDEKTLKIALAAKACEDAGVPVPKEAQEHLANLKMTASQVIDSRLVLHPVPVAQYKPVDVVAGRFSISVPVADAARLGAEMVTVEVTDAPRFEADEAKVDACIASGSSCAAKFTKS
jgi:hypothetical protein